MNRLKSTFKIGICQFKATENKFLNLEKALTMAERAKELGADAVSFGEMFNQPYNKELFPKYAEPVPALPPTLEPPLAKFLEQRKKINRLSDYEKAELIAYLKNSPYPTYCLLKAISMKYSLLVIGGSLCEAFEGKLYNSCYVFDLGEQIGKHRKAHMFDIDIPGQITFKESETLTAGDKVTVVKSRLANFGIGICYDIRFASFAMAMRQLEAEVLVYPSVFNLITGPRHYHGSGQARALDTQCYVVLSSTARYEEKQEYMQSFGHSAFIDFNGKIINNLGKEEDLLMADVDLAALQDNRQALPYTSSQQRTDIYELIVKKKE